MSFILDALRKSEHERQRQAGPALADIPVMRPPATRVPVTALVIGTLVLVNAAVLAYVLLRERDPAPTPAAGAAAAVPAGAPAAAQPAALPIAPIGPPAAPAVEPAPPPAASVPATRELRPLTDEVAPAYDQPPPPQYAAPAARDPALLPPRPAAAAAYGAPRARGSDEMLPTLDSLPAQATAGLPPLNLDLHVYATQPAQRFVFINNRRYLEGAATPEGVTVERITPDGVVLAWRGSRFLLPRQ